MKGVEVMADLERIALFIDGANCHRAFKDLGIYVDYKLLLEEFRSRGRLVRAYYYTTIVETGEFASLRPLVDWLSYNGFTVATKPAKEFVNPDGRTWYEGKMSTKIAVDAMEMADKVDHIILFSGDGDLRCLVEAIQRKGVRVSVVSTLQTASPSVADELRRQADEFIELAHIAPRIARAAPSIEQAPSFAREYKSSKEPGRTVRTVNSGLSLNASAVG